MQINYDKKGNLVISTKLKCKLATITSYKDDVSSVSPSSERMEELWVVYGFIWRISRMKSVR